MPKKITPSLFNQRCAFGSVKTVQNEANMGQHIEFLASFSLWCYAKKEHYDKNMRFITQN